MEAELLRNILDIIFNKIKVNDDWECNDFGNGEREGVYGCQIEKI